MSKLGFYDNKTGEDIDSEIAKSVLKNEHNNEIKMVFKKYEKSPDSLTLEELSLLKKTLNLSSKIQLNFSQDTYFTVKNNLEFLKSLSAQSRGALYLVGHMITHDGRLKYDNNRIIPGFEELRNHLGISRRIWNKYVKPDIDMYKIIVKEKIHDKWCLLLNPLFAVKDRTVTETMFIAFHDFLESYLHPIDYLYLKKLHGIDPKKVSETDKKH